MYPDIGWFEYNGFRPNVYQDMCIEHEQYLLRYEFDNHKMHIEDSVENSYLSLNNPTHEQILLIMKALNFPLGDHIKITVE